MERHQRIQLKTTSRSIDQSFKVSPFQTHGFGVQQKAVSTPASKAELWENYQRSTQMTQKGSHLPIQAKLSIGQPGDKYEQEADSVADRVMAMSEPAQVQREELGEEEEDLQMKPLAGTISPLVQRETLPEEEEEELQMKPEDLAIQREALPEEEEEEFQMKSLDNSIQREALPEEEEEELQMKESPTSDPPVATTSLEDRLSSSKGGGSPLSDDVRSFMEPRFGADFSGVRVHTGSDAVQMNQDVNAQAFAHGQDVYFGAGKAPGKDALTAHELTHVLQQTGGVQRIEAKPQLTGGFLPMKTKESIIYRTPETQPLPNWGSTSNTIGSNKSNMTFNPLAKLILDGKPVRDDWDLSRSKPAVFTAPKCTKNGEIQIVVAGYWFQNNTFGNESGEGQVTVSTAFNVNEKGELHFKAATESHTIQGSAAQMTGTGVASDNPPNGGSLVTQVAINSTDSKSVGPSGGLTAGGKFTPGGVGVDGSATGGVSRTVTTPSSNSFSGGYRADLTLEKRETNPISRSQPVYFNVNKHKVIGGKDKGQVTNIKDIFAFLQQLPPDVRKDLEDGKADSKTQIQVIAKASVTTPPNADAGFNLELSEKRRDAVVRVLQAFLGANAKIKAKAVGELEAVDPGESGLERVATIFVDWENDPCKSDSTKQ